MKIKAKEIANKLGVSEATVSLALNGKPGVGEQTRRNILKCAGEMRRAEAARNGTEIKNGCVKALKYASQNAYYDDITAGLFSISYLTMFQMASERGLDVKLLYVHDDEEETRRILKESETDGTLGIYLYASSMPESTFRFYRECKLPLVVNEGDFENSPFDSVMIDNKDAVENCMRYLHEMGHSDILYFNNSTRMQVFLTRQKSFLENCEKYGIPDGQTRCFDMGVTIEDAYANVMEYLGRGGRLPSAILAANFSVAFGTISALRSSGYRIPEDVSILGIDELPRGLDLDFVYTYVKVFHQEKARKAMLILLERMEGMKPIKSRTYVGTELIIGNSVKNLRLSV